MKRFFKDLALPAGMIGGTILMISVALAAVNVDRGHKSLNCDEFYVVELIVPVVPLACLFSKKVYP